MPLGLVHSPVHLDTPQDVRTAAGRAVETAVATDTLGREAEDRTAAAAASELEVARIVAHSHGADSSDLGM